MKARHLGDKSPEPGKRKLLGALGLLQSAWLSLAFSDLAGRTRGSCLEKKKARREGKTRG